MEFITISKAKKQTGLSYIGGVNKSAKLIKNNKVSGQYTYGVYLAPAKLSGYNVCPFSTPECRMGCLNTSGRTGIELTAGKSRNLNSRIRKTRLFYEQPEFFMAWMISEIKKHSNKAKELGLGFSVRLNCTSDIDWANVHVNGKNIFELFPEVKFYDYTKNPYKFYNKPENYHLTFSYTGRNWELCKELLNKGINVAVVFNIEKANQLPAMFRGYPVINGDLTDYRIEDNKGVIVGLKWKRIANKENEKKVLRSCFVVQPDDINTHEGERNNIQSVYPYAYEQVGISETEEVLI